MLKLANEHVPYQRFL